MKWGIYIQGTSENSMSLTFWISLNDLDGQHAYSSFISTRLPSPMLSLHPSLPWLFHISYINTHHPTSPHCLSTQLSQLHHQPTPDTVFGTVRYMGSTCYRIGTKLPSHTLPHILWCTLKDLVNPVKWKAGFNFAGEKVLFCHPSILPLM